MMHEGDYSIIVVDDQESGRLMMASALKQSGYQDVRLAESAGEALDEIRERNADIILADWIMPEMDGLELTCKIRQSDEENGRYTSIILITAKEGIENLVTAFEQGVDDYLTKPLDTRELAARVYSAGRISTLQNTVLETMNAMQEQNRELQQMAQTDPLTMLGNRRYMQDHLEAALMETANRGGGTCCAIVDIDHFKKINDQYGHDVGDEVLIGVAQRLRRSLRPSDILSRMGGEEFAITMRFNDARNFKHAIFGRIQKSVGAVPIRTSAGEITVTVSMGVCCRFQGDPGMEMDLLVKCADQKLYKAKKKGRNQVIY